MQYFFISPKNKDAFILFKYIEGILKALEYDYKTYRSTYPKPDSLPFILTIETAVEAKEKMRKDVLRVMEALGFKPLKGGNQNVWETKVKMS